MTAAPTTGPRISLTDIRAAARPNKLVADLAKDAEKAADLAEAARAARRAESNRLARIAADLVDEGNTEGAVLLLHDAIALLTAA